MKISSAKEVPVENLWTIENLKQKSKKKLKRKRRKLKLRKKKNKKVKLVHAKTNEIGMILTRRTLRKSAQNTAIENVG